MHEQSFTLGERHIRLETGVVAKQAHGAVLVEEGDTVLLVTATAAADDGANNPFFPLTVEYREKFSAAGKFPGGYRKREGRISDHEVLACRLVDRTVRPLFPKGFRTEVQLQATVFSYGVGTDPEVLAILGAAAALGVSELPFAGPVAAVRVGDVAGTLTAMPTMEERGSATLDLVVSASQRGLCMVEGTGDEVPEARLLEALGFAETALVPVLEAIDALAREAAPTKRQHSPPAANPEVEAAVATHCLDAIDAATQLHDKRARREALAAARRTGLDAQETDHDHEAFAHGFDTLTQSTVRRRIVEDGARIDGRRLDEVRPISGKVGWLPRVHGSSLFTRGETQAIVSCTLGTGADEQEVEHLAGKERERFYLHYSFPPYSVGETRPLRGPGRREIGHGRLAQRALTAVLPSASSFPYTIRIESEISESNGSSSMASVCGGCLALMDAGVPISRPVAGIAMGLVADGDKIAILSDILGDEDHLGDMDFKVAGTEVGVTAVQMDNKLGSLPQEVLARAVEQARQGRLVILGEMAKIIDGPRTNPKPNAPRIAVETIRPHRIRELIGPGGSIIQGIQGQTGAKLDVGQDGTVRILGASGEAVDAALARVRELVGEPEVGRVYQGVITGVKDFGCFVKVPGGIEGLIHISELSGVASLEEGKHLDVQVTGVDGQGRVKMARAS